MMYTDVERIRQAVEKHLPECRELADYMTDHPETGMETPLASTFIAELLRKKGYSITAPVKNVESSFLAVRKDRLNDNGPRAVLLCETDALLGLGHACGHSVSAASSVLAALAAAELCAQLPLRIDIMGTPGEEYPGGKVFLARAGAFDGYEFAMMTHMASENSPDFVTLACNDRHIIFRGKSSHASDSPEKGINALNAARLFMEAMDMWRQHIPKTSQLHGVVEKGGTIPSAVPDLVELNYYFRAKNLKELQDLCDKAEKAMQGAALATGASVEWEQRYETYSDLQLNPMAREMVLDTFDMLGMKYVTMDNPHGTTDMGDVDQLIPTFHLMAGVTGGRPIPLHDPEFEKCMKTENAYEGMRNAAAAMASLLLRLGEDAALREEIKLAHQALRTQ